MTDLGEVIDLDRMERAERLHGLVASGAAEPFGLYVVAAGDPRGAALHELEQMVFLEAFGNTTGQLASEYDRYEDSSVLVGVVDHRRSVVAGVLRLILPSPAGLKSWDDVAEGWSCDPAAVLGTEAQPASPTDFWDIATVAVHPEYRRGVARGLISTALYQTYSVMACAAGVPRAVAILDLAVLRLLQSNLKRPLTPLPGLEPKPYLGSAASIPVSLDMASYLGRMRIEDRYLYDIGTHGVGLEKVVRLPDWASAGGLVRSLSRR